MTGMDERLAKVAEVVGEHSYDTGWRCSCEWTGSADEYDAHFAQALKPLLAEWQAEDEARVLRQAVDLIDAETESEVSRLGGIDVVRANTALNNWIGGFRTAAHTVRAALDGTQS